MDAHKLWMLRDFIGTNKVLFRIPVYQRNYDWSESNCNRLLDDIYSIIQSGDKHFLGTIVFMAAKSGGFSLTGTIQIQNVTDLCYCIPLFVHSLNTNVEILLPDSV